MTTPGLDQSRLANLANKSTVNGVLEHSESLDSPGRHGSSRVVLVYEKNNLEKEVNSGSVLDTDKERCKLSGFFPFHVCNTSA